MDIDPVDLPQPDVLLCAALYLMTSYAKTGCPFVGHMISQQLRYLALHPGDMSPALRKLCKRAAQDWHHIAHPAACAVAAESKPKPTASRVILH